jgi:hypothetical protein
MSPTPLFRHIFNDSDLKVMRSGAAAEEVPFQRAGWFVRLAQAHRQIRLTAALRAEIERLADILQNLGVADCLVDGRELVDVKGITTSCLLRCTTDVAAGSSAPFQPRGALVRLTPITRPVGLRLACPGRAITGLPVWRPDVSFRHKPPPAPHKTVKTFASRPVACAISNGCVKLHSLRLCIFDAELCSCSCGGTS